MGLLVYMDYNEGVLTEVVVPRVSILSPDTVNYPRLKPRA